MFSILNTIKNGIIELLPAKWVLNSLESNRWAVSILDRPALPVQVGQECLESVVSLHTSELPDMVVETNRRV
jgi:hypothetical protein